MFCFHSSSVVDQHLAMAKSANSHDPYLKLKQINQLHKRRSLTNLQNQLNIPACEQSPYAMIDVVILIAVIGSCGVLIYPYVAVLVYNFNDLFSEVGYVVKEEILLNPMIYGCLGLSILFATAALLAITLYLNRTCGNPGCRGLRRVSEFDIQLETEDCVKNSNYVAQNGGVRKGLLSELARDHHRELEAELKKMAPPNGRAVLVFRASCGCSIGRLEVPGPKKPRKLKAELLTCFVWL